MASLVEGFQVNVQQVRAEGSSQGGAADRGWMATACSRLQDLATCLDRRVCFPITGRYALAATQQSEDRQLIDRIDRMIYDEMKHLPSYLESDFPGNPPHAVEREAAHSYWVRVFIHRSQIPAKAQEFIKTLNDDQKRVALAYLTAIDKGSVVETKYAQYVDRIAPFKERFLEKADRDERAYYDAKRLPTPDTLIDGNPVRPRDGSQRINLGPKFMRHPVTALVLAEFRRELFPGAQRGVDAHFHFFNMDSRPKVIAKMKEGPKTVERVDGAIVKTYELPVQVEFFPNRKITERPSYLTDIQGAGALTTQAHVKEFRFANGETVYLIRYQNYKTFPTTEKYMVSRTIPIGDAGEQYEAELDLAEAQAKLQEYSRIAQ